MLTRGQLWTTRAKLAAATITAAMLASLTLLLALSAHPEQRGLRLQVRR